MPTFLPIPIAVIKFIMMVITIIPLVLSLSVVAYFLYFEPNPTFRNLTQFGVWVIMKAPELASKIIKFFTDLYSNFLQEINGNPVSDSGNSRECQVNIRTRQCVDEEKNVNHSEPHSWFGFSSYDHTHYGLFHITYTEQCQENIYNDGNITRTQWVQVGSEKRKFVMSGEELGWTPGYRHNLYCKEN